MHWNCEEYLISIYFINKNKYNCSGDYSDVHNLIGQG